MIAIPRKRFQMTIKINLMTFITKNQLKIQNYFKHLFGASVILTKKYNFLNIPFCLVCTQLRYLDIKYIFSKISKNR